MARKTSRREICYFCQSKVKAKKVGRECDICGKIFDTRGSLWQHKRRHRGKSDSMSHNNFVFQMLWRNSTARHVEKYLRAEQVCMVTGKFTQVSKQGGEYQDICFLILQFIISENEETRRKFMCDTCAKFPYANGLKDHIRRMHSSKIHQKLISSLTLFILQKRTSSNAINAIRDFIHNTK